MTEAPTHVMITLRQVDKFILCQEHIEYVAEKLKDKENFFEVTDRYGALFVVNPLDVMMAQEIQR